MHWSLTAVCLSLSSVNYFISELTSGLFLVMISYFGIAGDKTQAAGQVSSSPSSSFSELDVKQEAGWQGAFGEQALSNLLWSGFICRSMWIKPLHVGRLALTAAAFTVQMSPRLRHRYSKAGNKSCVEHMEGKMRDVKRGESTWKQMKRYTVFLQPLQNSSTTSH